MRGMIRDRGPAVFRPEARSNVVRVLREHAAKHISPGKRRASLQFSLVGPDAKAPIAPLCSVAAMTLGCPHQPVAQLDRAPTF
jgi:hypothetical protein